MKNNGFIFAIIGVIALIFVAGFWLSSSPSKNIVVEINSEAKAVVATSAHDWGEISMKDGLVEATFDVMNQGEGVLQLHNITTSCSCTNAQLFFEGGASPMFGMHSKSKYVKEVAPGETIQVKAIFDPAFHGPGGVGPLTRDVSVETNDPNNPLLTFIVSANVTK